MYRTGFIIDGILGATGTVMLIRYFLAKIESEAFPYKAKD